MRRLRLYLALITLALGAPVLAQGDVNYTGPVSVVQGGTLVESISSALAESNQQLGDELEASLGTALDSAITEATGQLTAGGTVGGLFQSPAFLASIFALVNAVIVFLTTNSIKLSTLLRGKPTLLLAAVLSAITSGLGVYFGPGGGEGTPERIALAVAAALGTLGGAVGIHETSQALKTGMRKPERKRAKAEGRLPINRLFSPELDNQVENVIEGVVETALAYALPPPVAALIADSFGPVVLDAAETALKRPLDKAERLELLEARKAAISAGVAEQVEAARPKKPSPKPDEKVKLTRPGPVSAQPHVTPTLSEDVQEQEI